MGLFQRKPIELTQTLPYHITTSSKTLLVVGLGNVGKDYEYTRHNVGFLAIDMFAEKNEFSPWQKNPKLKGLTTHKDLGSTRVILLKPDTNMNLSGQSVLATSQFYKIPPQDMIIIHDEADIPFGQIRTRIGGQSAGHNGIKSIIDSLGNNFGRIRIGIANDIRPIAQTSNFVLGKFTKPEQKSLPTILNEVCVILTESIYGGQLGTETRKTI